MDEECDTQTIMDESIVHIVPKSINDRESLV